MRKQIFHTLGVFHSESYFTRHKANFIAPKKERHHFGCRFFWCERRDLNPYGITTRPSNVRVCRFRHSRECLNTITPKNCFVNCFLKNFIKNYAENNTGFGDLEFPAFQVLSVCFGIFNIMCFRNRVRFFDAIGGGYRCFGGMTLYRLVLFANLC